MVKIKYIFLNQAFVNIWSFCCPPKLRGNLVHLFFTELLAKRSWSIKHCSFKGRKGNELYRVHFSVVHFLYVANNYKKKMLKIDKRCETGCWSPINTQTDEWIAPRWSIRDLWTQQGCYENWCRYSVYLL